MIPAHIARLEMFKRAYQASLQLHNLTKQFPKHEQYELASQLRRASKSICANMVEGIGKNQSSKETERFITIAIGSNDEVKLWLMYCFDLKYLSIETYQYFEKEYGEIGAMLYGFRRSIKAKR